MSVKQKSRFDNAVASGPPAQIGRDDHIAMTCGKSIGPDEWLKAQQNQEKLIEQSRAMAGFVDEIGTETRLRLARSSLDFVEYVVAVEKYLVRHNMELPGEPTPWGDWCRDWRKLGAGLSDPAVHPAVCIVIARKLISSARKSERYLHGYGDWPGILSRVTIRLMLAFLRLVVRMPYAKPVENHGEQPKIMGLITGASKEVERFRELRMIPAIAQQQRRPLLNAARYWLEHYARRDGKGEVYARYIVVTNGQRVGFEQDLKAAVVGFQRRISRWAALSRELGVEVLFRGTEFTLSEDGYHLHANLLVEPVGFLGAKKWDAYLDRLHRHFGTWARDNGRIKDVAEMIKYVAKPTEIEKHILDHKDRIERGLQFYNAMYRARLIAPMGRFRDAWRAIESKKLKVACIGEKTYVVPKFTPAEASSAPKEAGENVIMCELLPNRMHTPWNEPSLMVLGYTETPQTEQGKHRLAYIQARREVARLAWNENGAPAPEVALATALAWQRSETSEAAAKVWAIGSNRSSSSAAKGGDALSPRKGCAADRGGVPPLYSSQDGLTVRTHSVRQAIFDPPWGGERNQPPTFVENGWLIDAETGEILGKSDAAGRSAA